MCIQIFHAINIPQLFSILHSHGTPFRAIWSVMELVKLHRRPRILPLAQLLHSPQTLYPGLCRNDGLPAAVTRGPPCFKFLNLSALVKRALASTKMKMPTVGPVSHLNHDISSKVCEDPLQRSLGRTVVLPMTLLIAMNKGVASWSLFIATGRFLPWRCIVYLFTCSRR